MAHDFEKDPKFHRELQDALVRANVKSAEMQPDERQKALEDAHKEVVDKWKEKEAAAKEKAKASDKAPAKAKSAPIVPGDPLATDPRNVAENFGSPAPEPGASLKP